jgi:hypothetical protein
LVIENLSLVIVSKPSAGGCFLPALAALLCQPPCSGRWVAAEGLDNARISGDYSICYERIDRQLAADETTRLREVNLSLG